MKGNEMQAVRGNWGRRDRILIIHLIFEGGIEGGGGRGVEVNT